MKINKLFLAGLSLFFLGSCSSDVDFGEQYKKIIYIVNSDDKAYVREHKIISEEQEGGISLYCGGSDVLKEDVKVTIVSNVEAMEAYNNKNFEDINQHKKLIVLPDEYYSIASYSVTIKAGTEYLKFPIILKTEGLNADSSYAIPLSISDASNYEINKDLQTIFYQIKLVNEYSGDYIGLIQNIRGVDDTVFAARDKHFKAIKEREIRTSIYNFNDEIVDIENMKTNLMLLTVAADNSVRISAWEDAYIEDLGGSKYYPETHQMVLNYKCKNSADEILTLREILVDVDYIVKEE